MTQLQPYISERFNGELWKFIIDPGTQLLFAEIRNVEVREASFASIDLKTGKTNFKQLNQNEKWMTGLEASLNGVIFLHGYESAQSPVHKGITSFDGYTGAQMWNNYLYVIQTTCINGLIAYNTQIQSKKLVLLDASTGNHIRNYDPNIDVAIPQEIQVPHILTHLSEDIKTHMPLTATGNIHYMEYNDFRIVSLHTLNKGIMQQILFIIKNGQLVFNDLLNDNIQKLQPEAFIMHRSQLIFIKNKNELKVLNL